MSACIPGSDFRRLAARTNPHRAQADAECRRGVARSPILFGKGLFDMEKKLLNF